MAELETQKKPENGYKFAGPIRFRHFDEEFTIPMRHLTRCGAFIKYTVPCKMSQFLSKSRRQRRRPQYKKKKIKKIALSFGWGWRGSFAQIYLDIFV